MKARSTPKLRDVIYIIFFITGILTKNPNFCTLHNNSNKHFHCNRFGLRHKQHTNLKQKFHFAALRIDWIGSNNFPFPYFILRAE